MKRSCIAGALLTGWLTAAGPVVLADFDAGLAAADSGDYETAMAQWIPLAAEGVAEAQYNVAVLYLNAWGVEQDTWEALTWLWTAAEQGHADAQYALATIYAHGVDIPIDVVQAYAWYALAAHAGHPLAATGRDAVLARLPASERPAADALARALKSRYGAP